MIKANVDRENKMGTRMTEQHDLFERKESKLHQTLASRALIIGAILFAILLSGFVAIRAGLFQGRPDHIVIAAPEISSSENFNAALVIKTVERRCVTCHGCYDAPCQFRMTSVEGISRGASNQPVYNSSRINEAPLTRLDIDASSVEEWRDLGFFDIVPTDKSSDPAQSILWRMLALGRKHPVPDDAPLPESIDLDITRDLTCSAPAEFDHYEHKTPFGGMPYATAPLNDDEWEALSAWVSAGAPAIRRDLPTTNELAGLLAKWEAFLNGETLRERLVARYLYEHLFLAHLYFSETDSDAFFKLVRSTTPPGQPIRIVATRRPYDSPGSEEFYYRLSRVTETILHKTHITYEIGADRLARYRELFVETDWSVTELPSYEPAIASNPFAAFAAIPADARYQFLLDDAEYFIRTFIRGPVCRGQVAVNVIEDRFWVMFLAPNADLSISDPEYLAEAATLLGLPAQHAEGPLFERLVPAYLDHHRQYAELRERRYADADPRKEGPSLNAIWQGDPRSGAPLLTVFRHFDNATVVSGFYGDVPETAWVIDFPTLERIYYNLVAGFDVFGSVGHQVATRVYMDLLRMESEDLFLSFLPPDRRRDLHEDWYRGGHTKIRVLLHRRPLDIDHDTQINFESDDPKAELLFNVLNRDQSGLPKEDTINRPSGERNEVQAEIATLASLASIRGSWVQYFPDLTLLKIKRTSGANQVYTLIHDKAHTNVAFLFAEGLRREPAKDTLTIMKGPIGSYPNLFLVADEADLARFERFLKAVETKEEWLSFIDAYGVRRSSPLFWETADFFQDTAIGQHPREGGLLDLNRYVDP